MVLPSGRSAALGEDAADLAQNANQLKDNRFQRQDRGRALLLDIRVGTTVIDHPMAAYEHAREGEEGRHKS